MKNYLTEKEIKNLNKWAKKHDIKDLKIKDKEQILSISIRNDKIEHIPADIFKLTNLKKLDILCKNLMELSEDIKNLSNLKEFHIYCHNLKKLPKGIWDLINLEELYIYCNNLESLPNEIKKLINLESINIERTVNLKLKDLPMEGIGELNNIKELCIDI